MSEHGCYVGIKSCGCAVAAIVDTPEDRKHTAKEVAKWMREGLVIERRSVEWARANLTPCKHEKRPPAMQESLL